MYVDGFTRTTIPANCPDSRVLRLDARFFSPDALEKRLQDFKLSCPLFSFREAVSRAKGRKLNYIQGIIADFDNLPYGFATFDELYAHLSERHPDALVFRSARNKVKAIWFVRAYCQHISDEDSLAFLRERLPDLFGDVDHNSSAMSVSFMDAAAIDAFYEFVAKWGTDDSFIATLPSQARIDYSTLTPSSHTYKEAPLAQMPLALEEQISMCGRGLRGANLIAFRQLFTILVACPGLLQNDGFGLSTVILERQLGVSNVTVSRWLRDLCELGFLKYTGNKPVPGKKAKHFVATKLLLIQAIEACAKATVVSGDMPATPLQAVVRKQAQRGVPGCDFRRNLGHIAAAQGHTLEELVDAITAELGASYWNEAANLGRALSAGRGRNNRRKELTASFNSALRKKQRGAA